MNVWLEGTLFSGSETNVVPNKKTLRFADSYILQDRVIYKASSNGRWAYIAGYEIGATGSVDIPDSIVFNEHEYHVKGIFEEAFKGALFTKVSLPASFQIIQGGAFSDCSELTDLIFKEKSITEIGSFAFANCSSLRNIKNWTLPRQIGSSIFYGCFEINLSFPNTSFFGSSKPEGYSLAYTLAQNAEKRANAAEKRKHKTLEDGTMLERIGKTLVKVENRRGIIVGVEMRKNDIGFGIGGKTLDGYEIDEIAEGAFENLDNLEWIRISMSIRKIGARAFRNCTNLRILSMGTNLEEIGESAFENCSSIECIYVLPNRIQRIGANAFKGCSNLTILKRYKMKYPPECRDISIWNPDGRPFKE